MAGLVFKTMKLGDKSNMVKRASLLLQKKGSTIKVTTEFHIGMVSAVKAFQRKNKLPVTGVIDRKTWDKLIATPKPTAKKKTK